MKINFHIFTSSSLKNDLEKIENLIKQYKNLIIMIHFVNDEELKNLPTEFIWTRAIYFRFLIPHALYELGIKECWYLDSDELCVNKIPKMPKSHHPIGALIIKNPEKDRRDFLYKLTNNKNIWDIYSAGIYIYIDNYVKNEISEKIFYNLENDDLRLYKFFDLDALVKVLNNDIESFEEKFNYVYNLHIKKDEIPKDTIFIHFAGSAKPWKIWASDYEQTKIWLKYKEISPWKNTPLEEPKKYKESKFLYRYAKRIKSKKSILKALYLYVVLKIKEKIL